MRLFWRIFAWYLATTFVLLGLGIGALILTDPESLFSPSVSVSRDALHAQAETSLRDWRQGGAARLRASFEKAPRKRFLFDAGAVELAGQPVPEALRALAQRAQNGQSLEIEFISPDTYAALGLTAADGRFAYAAVLPPERRFRFYAHASPLVLRIALGVLTGCVICLLFARYVTAPLVRIQAAAREFAGGNLQARVGSSKPFNRNDEFSDLARDFDEMASRIQNSVSIQQRMLGDISHELRSPLTRLQLALEIARRRLGPAAGDSLDRIEQEAERMNEMIGDVLRLAKTEQIHPSSKKLFDLANVVTGIVADADFEANAGGKHVVTGSNEHCLMHGNRDLIRSAIENVVRNAIRYTQTGTNVTVDLRREGAQAQITVRDHGPGVPEDALPQLFQPFYRVADARDRNSGGAGLGLAITHHAVLAHGGRVRAQNRVPGGLEIEIELPVVTLEASPRSGIKFRTA